MAEISAAQVAEAEAALVVLKSRRNASAKDKQAKAEEVAALRAAFRRQEEAAGRRTGLVQVEG